MIRIVLVALAVLLIYSALRPSFARASAEQIAKYARLAAWTFVAVLGLALAASGGLNWLFALCGVIAASLVRLAPLLLRYAPYFQRLWYDYRVAREAAARQYDGYHRQYTRYDRDDHRRGESSAGAGGPGSAPGGGKMTRAEAYEVLGLKPGASEQEIIAAHRKLMQKLHPDRGGSDYLAAKINLAKKVLLNR